MFEFSFVLPVFFLVLGPLKVIPAFAQLTRDADLAYRRRAAVYATLFASAICVVLGLLARTMADNYRLSVVALQLTAGLILLIWSLNAIFARGDATPRIAAHPSPVELAMSPLATPVIITPAGVAALMVFVLLDPNVRGGHPALVGTLALVMALNFLVMYFNDQIVKLQWLLGLLQLLGSVLVVVQVAFAVQVILNVLRTVGVIQAVFP
jgi:multiple antibiotic resistance protein